MIPRVHSLAQLKTRAKTDPRYAQLAMIAARNLGGDGKSDPFRWLELNAMETSEAGVVGEINFCRDLIDNPPNN